MRLPDVTLDDRRFQDIVDEARRRIAESCPEWTEHNVSDPGITLIELFAWMTEMLVYRVNRIPEKVHVELLDLLGLRLAPPSAASTDLRFRLTGPSEEAVLIRGGDTEVATQRGPGEEPVVFQVLEDFSIPPLTPSAYALERGGELKDVGVAAGVARPTGGDREPFGSPPRVGDALYVGLDEPLGRLVARIDVECSAARGAGVAPEDPPLVWEVSTGETGEDAWQAAEVLLDTTGGFNYGSGAVELQLPPRSGRAAVAGQRAYWIRCRVSETTRSGKGSTAFSHPPVVHALTASALGALLPAVHAVRQSHEQLGPSDGTAGQSFALRYRPLLEPTPAERLEVLEPGAQEWVVWDPVESFVDSGPDDAHYVLDAAAGVVELGPAVRQADGSWRRYGGTPPKAARLRMSGYRHGGGRAGNVAAGTLRVLRAGIPGVDTVTNPEAALGGVDAGSLAELRQRAALELRTRFRAVTREDFEHLARDASPRVARAICVPPEPGGAVRVHVVPRIEPADRPLLYEELVPDEDLLAEVAAYLDERRLIGTSVDLLPAKYRAVTVVVNVQVDSSALRARVEQDVSHALYTYLNPVVGGTLDALGGGWPFGRALNQGELYGVVHSVPGVEHVNLLRVYETDLRTGEQQPQPAGTHVLIEPDETIASATHIVRADHRTR